MIVGAKYLTWAPYASGGEGGAITYGTGTAETDKVVRVDMSEERSDVPFHADDHRIDRDNSINGASLSIDLMNDMWRYRDRMRPARLWAWASCSASAIKGP